jgi:hypothetical protein
MTSRLLLAFAVEVMAMGCGAVPGWHPYIDCTDLEKELTRNGEAAHP